MNPINPATFAANLRADMVRMKSRFGAFVLTEIMHDHHGGDPEQFYGMSCELLDEDRPPTPAEVTALAAALGCPESRLLVSREELEAEVERLREVAKSQPSDIVRLLGELGHLQDELTGLRRAGRAVAERDRQIAIAREYLQSTPPLTAAEEHEEAAGRG